MPSKITGAFYAFLKNDVDEGKRSEEFVLQGAAFLLVRMHFAYCANTSLRVLPCSKTKSRARWISWDYRLTISRYLREPRVVSVRGCGVALQQQTSSKYAFVAMCSHSRASCIGLCQDGGAYCSGRRESADGARFRGQRHSHLGGYCEE